ncbi:MAG: LysR family transcriptional regulator, glycine cleavage system transcriptional activator [Sphingomonadales bacterium]|jgi:LysR family glycine cleavage system transcriptional activator|nr:LysR family transcriptional regulator, glycine cleavage system transcriptional activator [Sphingomonadales bacterium]MEA3050776.1 LysR family transcriptional regulator, glycine cleavage system transcriptional activator [Sphingomonadales bacterium]
MRRLPPLAAVRAFEAAARHENFTLAAAELGLTQAAVSYQIRLLEERLGLPLFIRSKRRVTLSEAGRRIMPLVSGAFDDLSDAFAGLVDEDESVLTISTTQTFGSNWLAPRLGGFQVARPDLAVRLQAENALIDFARGEVDVGVRMGLGPWPGLRHHFLWHLHAAPFCSPEFRERHRLETPEDVLRVPWLTPDDEWWKLWLEKAGVAPRDEPGGRGIRLDSQVSEGQMALAGHGLSMLTPIYWQAEVAAGRLVRPFDIMVCEKRATWLVYPEHKRGRAKVRHFRDWLLAEVAEMAKQGPAEVFTSNSPLPGGEG